MIYHGLSFWFSYVLVHFVVLSSFVMFWLSSLCPFRTASLASTLFSFLYSLYFVFCSFSFCGLLPVSCVFAAFDF